MKYALFLIAGMIAVAPAVLAQKKEKPMDHQNSGVYSFVMKTIDGKEKPLSDYKGKVLMIVNVASKCGNTPQYKDLEGLYEKYKDRGFVILGFPANNFLGQEPGTNEDIKKFCTLNYGVTFDMFSKVSVKGKDQSPLYSYLTKESPVSGDVQWNFQKYLVDRNGDVVAKFSPRTKPTEKEVVSKLEQLLSQN
jgi:glutathione peroxidase